MHIESILAGIAVIVVCGIASEWIAWRLRLPSVLILLSVGLLIGPVAGLLKPDQLLGPILMPMVSLGVAIILFEGGLSLRMEEIRAVGRVVWLLITVGAAVTWLLTAFIAHFFLGFDAKLALLLGANLVVTGPTVVIPLLAHIRPRGRVGPILKWEGITIDPVGASLAVLVFEAFFVAGPGAAPSVFVEGILKTILIGAVFGGLGAILLIVLLRRHLVPDALQSPVALALVVGIFALSNWRQQESGLLSVTVMGAVLANQHRVDLHHVVTFKENLRVLVLSTVFIVLSARIDFGSLSALGVGSAAFLVALLFVVRPVAALLSTVGGGLSWRERAFVAYMAPRGVVAAAVASVFALRLQAEGHVAGADAMAPVTFLVIISTVVLYALTARRVAGALGLAQPDRNGVLIAGAHQFARGLAAALKAEGIDCLLVDRNRWNVSSARLAGLRAYHGDILEPGTHEDLDVAPMGLLLALTANDEVNSLASIHYGEAFGRQSVYQLPSNKPPKGDGEQAGAPSRLRGRTLFGPQHTSPRLEELCRAGGKFKVTKLTEKFTFESFAREHGGDAVVLGLITPRNVFLPKVEGENWGPVPGQRVVALVRPKEGADVES